MKLLVTTQIVDQSDPVLGFFHEWLLALAPSYESIEVICLKEGVHTLPAHVRIHSLGKERGGGKFVYALRFLSILRTLRGSYDAVLVHMNTEYVLLGAPLFGKKTYLWYNHPKGGVRLTLATLLSERVFHTSPFAASAGTKKSVRMPAGIDTSVFLASTSSRTPHSMYLQGRVAPSKRVNTACEALALLRGRGVQATLTVVGPEDKEYVSTLKERYTSLIQEGAITFLGPKKHHETPALYGTHAVAINLAASGHYDKTVLEALSTETPVIVASRAFGNLIPTEWTGKETPEALAEALFAFLSLSEEKQRALGREGRKAVTENESLKALTEALVHELRA
jgi:glycosyltransferase involved in cell wall biosynthesis